MKVIQLTFNITDELGLRSIIYDVNETTLPSNSATLKLLAIAMLKATKLNKTDLTVQDLLNELGIEKSG